MCLCTGCYVKHSSQTMQNKYDGLCGIRTSAKIVVNKSFFSTVVVPIICCDIAPQDDGPVFTFDSKEPSSRCSPEGVPATSNMFLQYMWRYTKVCLPRFRSTSISSGPSKKQIVTLFLDVFLVIPHGTPSVFYHHSQWLF
jgi:hypothetical protein